MSDHDKIEPFEPQLPASEDRRLELPRGYPLPEEGDEGEYLREYWRILRNQRCTVLPPFFVSLTLVTIDTVRERPLYRAQSMLEIGQENPNIVNQRLRQFRNELIQTQAGLCQKEKLYGLVNCLTGDVHWRTLLQPTGMPGLDCLVCGPLPPNPSELVFSTQMRALIRKASAEYDLVFIDAPPLNVADGPILSTMVEGLIMVVRAEAAPRRAEWCAAPKSTSPGLAGASSAWCSTPSTCAAKATATARATNATPPTAPAMPQASRMRDAAKSLAVSGRNGQ